MRRLRRDRHVNGLLHKDPFRGLSFKPFSRFRERGLDVLARHSHDLAGDGLVGLIEALDLLVGEGNGGVVAAVGEPSGLQFVRSGGDTKCCLCRFYAAPTPASSRGSNPGA